MNKTAFRLGVLLGFGFILTSAFTNCSSQGGYANPAQQSQQSSVQSTPLAPVQLTLSQTTPSVPMGESMPFSASGGSGVYTFSIAQPSIATIDASGNITGVNEGATVLTVTDSNGITGSALVTVNSPVVIPVYRANNQLSGFESSPVPGEHLYSLTELIGVNALANYKDEGIKFYVFKDPIEGSIPLYYCQFTGSQPYHFFSTNPACPSGKFVSAFGYIYPTSTAAAPAGTQPMFQRLDVFDMDELITPSASDSTQAYNVDYHTGTQLGFNPTAPVASASATASSGAAATTN